MRNIKNLIRLADHFISLSGKVGAQFKGKNPKEALALLKNNLSALRSPETLVNMQQVLQNKSPAEIRDLLTQAHKNLSAEDALKIAEILTDGKIDRQLPAYLDQKIKTIAAQKNPPKQAPPAPRKK